MAQIVDEDMRYREMAEALADQQPERLKNRGGWDTRKRITPGDVPRLREILEGEDAAAQCDALMGLCPCRNRVYNREVWRAIFEVYETTESAEVRDKASHAIQTLRERIRTDPRSQDLVRSLAGESPSAAQLMDAVPVWNPRPPRGRGELVIPRFERSHRSKANKPR